MSVRSFVILGWWIAFVIVMSISLILDITNNRRRDKEMTHQMLEEYRLKTAKPFIVSEYLARMEQTALEIAAEKRPVNQTVTLWFGLSGITLREDGATEEVTRNSTPDLGNRPVGGKVIGTGDLGLYCWWETGSYRALSLVWLSETAYNNLESRSPETFYWVSDTRMLYIGDIMIGNCCPTLKTYWFGTNLGLGG